MLDLRTALGRLLERLQYAAAVEREGAYLAWAASPEAVVLANGMASDILEIDFILTGKTQARSLYDVGEALLLLRDDAPWEVYLSDSGYSRLTIHPPIHIVSDGVWLHVNYPNMSAKARTVWDAAGLGAQIDRRAGAALLGPVGELRDRLGAALGARVREKVLCDALMVAPLDAEVKRFAPPGTLAGEAAVLTLLGLLGERRG